MQPFFLVRINTSMNRYFKKELLRILENDLGLNKIKHRQQSDRQGPMLGSLSQQMVPDYVKVDPSLHPKVENLRSKPNGKIVLNDNDVKQITDVYNIKNLSPNEPRECGTTGISIVFNNMTGKYQLEKGANSEKYK